MQTRSSAAVWLALLILLVAMLYPALALRRAVAPEISLRGQAPWRVQWGPFPAPLPQQVRAATELGARLSLLQRDLWAVAVWNPWIGGGRPGWLASAREGGTPLVLLAAMLARPAWAWTGLLALQLATAFLSCAWMLRRLGLAPWPAALGALCYSLSGPVASHWLDWQGPALALAPLGVALALPTTHSLARSAAGWGTALVLLGASGTPALPFVALAAVVATYQGPANDRPRRLLAAAIGAVIALALLAPRLWLGAAGREPEGPAPRAPAEAPLPTLRALAFAPARFDPAAAEENQRDADARGFLGLPTLALAGLGLVAAPLLQRGVWGGILVAGLALACAPGAWLERFGVAQRPLAVAALAAATLAGFGLARLIRGLEARRQALVGATATALVALSLLPVAARHVPFALPEEGVLPAPLPPAASPAEPRILGLLGCLPPDLGAAAGLADVRASFFDGEPRYEKVLGGGGGGVFSPPAALAPQVAALGVGMLLEPLPLRVVSNEIFSRIEVDDLVTAPGEDGTPRGICKVAPGTSRVGVSSQVRLAGPPALRLGARREELAADDTLAAESSEWRWFALPPLASEAALELALAAGGPQSVPLALDRSGLRQESESGGVRVWSWERKAPFASLIWPPDERPAAGPCPGLAEIRGVWSDGVSVAVNDSGSCWLRLQIKYRPALWQATVGGQPAQTFRCSEVWTCVPVPAGGAAVELKARLPRATIALSLAGLVVLAGLAWVGRKA